jgi:hypothetical protein
MGRQHAERGYPCCNADLTCRIIELARLSRDRPACDGKGEGKSLFREFRHRSPLRRWRINTDIEKSGVLRADGKKVLHTACPQLGDSQAASCVIHGRSADSGADQCDAMPCEMTNGTGSKIVCRAVKVMWGLRQPAVCGGGDLSFPC